MVSIKLAVALGLLMAGAACGKGGGTAASDAAAGGDALRDGSEATRDSTDARAGDGATDATAASDLRAARPCPGARPDDTNTGVPAGVALTVVSQDVTVTADGTTIDFNPPSDGPPAVVLPQDRVFSREYGERMPGKVSAEFFRRLLAGRGFTIEGPASRSSFRARRK